ncbi:MAG: Sensory box histidine kinase/response regulator [Labilithrix sp.]|nr:Sensory box histidine kinase/response regulator [Labilithrix sp.]
MARGGIETLHEGDELVRRIIDAVPGGVVYVRKDGSIRQANAAALRILGLRMDEATRRYVSDWDPETIREDGTRFPVDEYPVTRVLATGAAQTAVTLGIRRKDGGTSWAVFRAEPVHGADGDLAGAIVTFLDITERKEAEQALRASEERWRLLAQYYPDYIVVVDRQARITSVNRINGRHEAADVLGTSLLDYIDEERRDEFRGAFAEALAGTPTRLETRGQRGTRTHVWYETQLVPMAVSGAVTSVMVVSRDLTEQRAILASLAEKERLASVGMLASSVAHEIMNPLTYVLANLDFVVGERSGDPERRMRALVEAREGARRMQQIVWDLRALGRSGHEELFYVDPRSVLETALRLSGPEVQRTASVVLDLQADTPSVLASESRLCQVFINLLVNAAQAMESIPLEGREIRVRTRHDEVADLVGIDISDNGTGIDPERLDRIFEPFFTTKPSGTGLGLSICRDIVERMGGRIDVASRPGVGATFTVWLSTTRSRSDAAASRSDGAVVNASRAR